MKMHSNLKSYKLMKRRLLIPAVCSLNLLLLLSAPAAVFAEAEAAAPDLEALTIINAEATSANTIKVTLNEKLASFDPSDLELDAALGDWYGLDPKLTNTLTIKKATTDTNASGNTVVILETEQPLNPDATITRPPAAENPKSVPFLNASYYSGDRAKDIQQADNLLTWQMAHGGWYKMGDKYKRAWDGKEVKSDWHAPDGTDLGTIDNNATTNEILFLSVMYKETGDPRYKAAVTAGIDFLGKLQYATGGWAQVYPARGNYSDNVTFNDNAMMRVMNVLSMMTKQQYPFNTDIVSDDTRLALQQRLDRGLDYILKSQIVVNGTLTAWCAQHDPVTYAPAAARAYEHPSISGSESIDIIKYLMALPNPSPEVKRAVDGALSWFDASKLSGIKYVSADPNNVYFVPDPASTTWYRFYEIGTNLPIFSGRDGIIKHTILEIEAERRNGYRWGGNWAEKLLNIAKTTGYFENRAYVKVVGDHSLSASGHKLHTGDVKRVEDAIAPTLEMTSLGQQTGNHYNVSSNPLKLSGQLNEKAIVQINGAAAAVNEQLTFTSEPIPLHPGQNAITLTATDAAGNTSAPLTIQVVPNQGSH